MTIYSSAEALKSEVMNRLTTKLNGPTNEEGEILSVTIDQAYDEVESIRNYPETYTEDMILADMSRYFTNISELALYDYNQLGAEGETAHSENGISRTYKDRNACLKGVRPISAII